MYTEEQAVKKAVEEFEKKGLNCIEYKNGRRVNIADYTSMAVRTANQRAYMVGEGEFRKAIGETLVIISRHTTSCELCKPWEGKVLIDDVYSGGTKADGAYMLLSEAMAQGLYHPRCRHGLGTYYPELEEINGYQQKESVAKVHNKNKAVNILTKSNKNVSLPVNIQLFAINPSDFETIILPPDEYAHVMSEINTNITKEQLKRKVVSKNIGDYVYTFECLGFDKYRIINKVKIEGVD